MTDGVETEHESIVSMLSAATADGAARRAAMNALRAESGPPTTMISYASRGTVLVIGARDAAHEAAATLAERGLQALVLCPGAAPLAVRAQGDGTTTAEATLCALTGHLGNFVARVAGRTDPINLAREAGFGRDDFDLVLDLATPPAITREIPPPGYYAPQGDDAALAAALAELPDLVGEYEKPKYFTYDASICAHKARGIVGCRRCIDACPTEAITSIAESIEVDPYLCQGGGSCATACPTGAITYVYPTVPVLLANLRAALRAYTEAGGQRPGLLFYDTDAGHRYLCEAGHAMPENVIPVEVEEVGSVGMDVWLAALAYGAAWVAWLVTEAVPASVVRELEAQREFANALLGGMGFSTDRLRAAHAAPAAFKDLADAAEPLVPAAGFAGFSEKRTTLRLALDHLYRHAPAPKKAVPLPDTAPFGALKVERAACTLCMGCVAVCPASALSDGEGVPQLRFIEANCVQCGLCVRACPEDAITLIPRYTYDAGESLRSQVLNEEEPFLCIECGKPFATQTMMQRMQEKLKDHWMYQDQAALRRLSMCEDCRVKSVYAESGGLEVFPGRRPGNGG